VITLAKADPVRGFRHEWYLLLCCLGQIDLACKTLRTERVSHTIFLSRIDKRPATVIAGSAGTLITSRRSATRRTAAGIVQASACALFDAFPIREREVGVKRDLWPLA
jgi:hypothetical protein